MFVFPCCYRLPKRSTKIGGNWEPYFFFIGKLGETVEKHRVVLPTWACSRESSL